MMHGQKNIKLRSGVFDLKIKDIIFSIRYRDT